MNKYRIKNEVERKSRTWARDRDRHAAELERDEELEAMVWCSCGSRVETFRGAILDHDKPSGKPCMLPDFQIQNDDETPCEVCGLYFCEH